MTGYLLRRLAVLPLVLFGVTVIVFLTLALIPGDPAVAILGPYATPDRLAALHSHLALDRPLYVQYGSWIADLLGGDFGRSYSLDRPVIDEIAARIGPTMLLAGAALLFACVVGMAVGAIAAIRQYGWPDRLLTVAVLVGISMPTFWLGLILILAFAVWLHWFPAHGMLSIWGGGGTLDLLHHLVLPAITLGLVAGGILARITRTQMLEVLRQDFVRTARAKGLTERRVLGRHAFVNALVAVIPVIGLQAGFVLSGAVYVEEVFAWPGLGRMLVDAIAARDIFLVQGGVLVIAVGYVLINLVADLAQRALDPRIAA
jgi:peptide/nickel transport system permease protein